MEVSPISSGILGRGTISKSKCQVLPIEQAIEPSRTAGRINIEEVDDVGDI